MFNRDWNEKLEVITTETLRERAEKEFDEMNALTQTEIMTSVGAGLCGSAIDILCIKGPVKWVLFGKKKAKEDYIENYMIRELDNSYKGIWNGVQRLSPIRI